MNGSRMAPQKEAGDASLSHHVVDTVMAEGRKRQKGRWAHSASFDVSKMVLTAVERVARHRPST